MINNTITVAIVTTCGTYACMNTCAYYFYFPIIGKSSQVFLWVASGYNSTT